VGDDSNVEAGEFFVGQDGEQVLEGLLLAEWLERHAVFDVLDALVLLLVCPVHLRGLHRTLVHHHDQLHLSLVLLVQRGRSLKQFHHVVRSRHRRV